MLSEETLVFTFVGMQPVSVKVNSATINVRLKEESRNLDEVVVIGYGTSKKSDLTGSVVSVKNKELTKTSFTSFDQGLQGRIAGVEVVQEMLLLVVPLIFKYVVLVL